VRLWIIITIRRKFSDQLFLLLCDSCRIADFRNERIWDQYDEYFFDGVPDASCSSLWLRGKDGEASPEVISESDFEVFIDILNRLYQTVGKERLIPPRHSTYKRTENLHR
jgi:hypothetical protein